MIKPVVIDHPFQGHPRPHAVRAAGVVSQRPQPDRRLALNLLKQEKTKKVGIKSKSNACSWDHDHLIKVLNQG